MEIPPPQVSPPDNKIYPIKIHVDLWSDDFSLDYDTKIISLPFKGPTEKAKFRLELPRDKDKGIIFVFLRVEQELIAVFRVAAKISEVSEKEIDAQKIEYSYLATDWFRFNATPSAGGALTLYFREEGDRLQIFTLSPSKKPFGSIGIRIAEFHQITKTIYAKIHEIALEAARSNFLHGKNLTFDSASRELSDLGHQLYVAVFYSMSDLEVQKQIPKYLELLSAGSILTIATDETSRSFVIPWGLLYYKDPPTSILEGADVDGFFGAKFNIVVRPFSENSQAKNGNKDSILIGKAYYNHKEAKNMELVLADLNDKYEFEQVSLRAEKHSMPQLNDKSMNIIHFFCHGHTQLYDFALEENLEKQYIEHLQLLKDAHSNEEITSENLVMKLRESPTKGSFLLCKGGMVKYDMLAKKVPTLKGSPIVLLSMCESAQVSCSGVGFITFFLQKGAKAVIGTEGPSLWTLAKEIDSLVIEGLLEGREVGEVFWETRRKLINDNILALIYTLFGDCHARIYQ